MTDHPLGEKLAEYLADNPVEKVYIEILFHKQAQGLPLTDAEQACIAYSPYGTASACVSCGRQ